MNSCLGTNSERNGQVQGTSLLPPILVRVHVKINFALAVTCTWFSSPGLHGGVDEFAFLCSEVNGYFASTVFLGSPLLSSHDHKRKMLSANSILGKKCFSF